MKQTELEIASKRAIEAVDAYHKALNAEEAAYAEAQNLRAKARTLEAQAEDALEVASRVRAAAKITYDAALRAAQGGKVE